MALLFGNAVAANLTVIIAAVLFFLLVRDTPQFFVAMAWFIGITSACGLRLWIYAAYRRARDHRAIARWARIYILATLLVGVMWGALGLPLYQSELLKVQTLVFMLIIGAVTASVPVLASVLSALWAYVLPMLFGLALALLLKGTWFYAGVAAMVTIYGGLIARTALNTNRHLKASLDLQFRNEELISELNREITERKTAQHQLRQHGEQLEELVAERTGQLVDINASLKKEIGERERAEANLHYLAHHDPLTNLPNRLLLDARLGHSIQVAHRNHSCVAVLFLDLDNFKHINDSLGHEAGDQLLIEVSGRFERCVREDDTVARLGGDEFVIILEQVDDRKAVEPLAKKLLDVLKEGYRLRTQGVLISTSIGIAMYPMDGDTSERLIGCADAAMYKAKSLGRGNYQFYTPDLTERAYDRMLLGGGLLQALERHELVVHYQPLVSIAEGRVLGMEALVRWQHPELGLLGPERFLRAAEESGLMMRVGEFVLREACRQMRSWRNGGFAIDFISVNLSGLQIYDKGLVGTVQQALQAGNCRPEWLELEITESFIMQKAGQSIDTLYALREMGIRFAIDDFGTGYSSLSYLRRLPVDTLKIDQSFVREVDREANDLAIIQAIIAMARSLRLRVVAEGIETPEQAGMLQHLGCELGQGFFYGHPSPQVQAREHAERELKG